MKIKLLLLTLYWLKSLPVLTLHNHKCSHLKWELFRIINCSIKTQYLFPIQRFLHRFLCTKCFIVRSRFNLNSILRFLSDFSFIFLYLRQHEIPKVSFFIIWKILSLPPPPQNTERPIFCTCLNESKKEFSILDQRVAFGIALYLERHQDCKFRFKTNGEIKGVTI